MPRNPYYRPEEPEYDPKDAAPVGSDFISGDELLSGAALPEPPKPPEEYVPKFEAHSAPPQQPPTEPTAQTPTATPAEPPAEPPTEAAETSAEPSSEVSEVPAVQSEFSAEMLLGKDEKKPAIDERFFGGNEEFQQMLDETAPHEEPQEPSEPRTPHKGRPKRKKGEGLLGIPNILVTGVWLALILAIGVTLGRMVWICAAEVLAFGREDKTVVVTLYESDTIDDVTDKLYNAGLIHYPGLFKLYAKFAVDEDDIYPGMWDLNTQYDYHALVKMMSPSSSRKVVTVMIPEGYSCRQIFALLQENKVCTVQDLESCAASGELFDYWFLEGVERGSKYCLEGFLFPDTYEFYTNDTAQNVLSKMLANFNYRFDDDMRIQISALNGHLADLMRSDGHDDAYIQARMFTAKEVVTVASLIEKEMATADEGPTIASVIYNRLFHWGSTPPYLNIDAAIVYALDGKTDLTAADLQVDSPYNTYLHTGLPPTPIANPGLASIKSALNPASTNFYYYVLNPATGEHHFSKTLEEHEAFRESLR